MMNELIAILIRQLGVNEAQAKGGAGLLFKMAKDRLSDVDFAKIKNAIPDVDDLIRSAPKASGLLGGLATGLGRSKLGMLTHLAAGFKGLNLDNDQIAGYLRIIAAFLEAKGGAPLKVVMDALQATHK